MAEFLIKAVDATNPDPAKAARGCLYAGDVVVMQSDGREWGTMESLPPSQGGKFSIVRIPEITIEQVNQFIADNWDLESVAKGEEGVCRRVLALAIEELPQELLETLYQEGSAVVAWSDVGPHVINKVRDERAV